MSRTNSPCGVIYIFIATRNKQALDIENYIEYVVR